MLHTLTPAAAVLTLTLLAGGRAQAQAMNAPPAWASGGYNGAAASVGQGYAPSAQSVNGNNIIVNGEIQSQGAAPTVADQFAALSGGAGTASSGAGGGTATAIGNLLNITVNGSGDTVIVTNNQVNKGNVTADIGTGSLSGSQQGASGNGN